jgi:glycine/D-amino acid oxidase-like deaminating enzyme
LHSTYAFVSEPLTGFPGWPERCLIWETARPYGYMRTTDDNRLLAGGEDISIQSALVREFLAKHKLEAIEKWVRRQFPRIAFDIDFRWSGTFAETADGLPFIGAHPDRPGTLFALCFGGNGITYSALAAELIEAILAGKEHPLATIFGFSRKPRV